MGPAISAKLPFFTSKFFDDPWSLLSSGSDSLLNLFLPMLPVRMILVHSTGVMRNGVSTRRGSMRESLCGEALSLSERMPVHKAEAVASLSEIYPVPSFGAPPLDLLWFNRWG